jgi:hypothetical protein
MLKLADKTSNVDLARKVAAGLRGVNQKLEGQFDEAYE